MTDAWFNWRRLAACRKPDVDPAIFFPKRGRVDNSRALSLCAGCPVKAACLAEALADPGLIGVWGGTTHVERRQMLGGKSRTRVGVNVPVLVGVPRPVPREFFDPDQHRLDAQRRRRQLAKQSAEQLAQ